MQHPFVNEETNKLRLFTTHQLALNEYLLIIQPEETVYEKIMQEKKTFAETYDCPMAAYLKPHLTLISFVQYDMMEAKIIHRMQQVAAGCSSFKIDLNGFGSFPSHTIYVNLQTRKPVVQLVKQFRPLQALLKPDAEHKPHLIMEPHISICRKLLPWQYEKAWAEYQQKHFTASCMVNDIVLLRRNENNKAYRVVGKFPLLNKKVYPVQASLFS
ncbi:MAG: 2'-5' RNA ligase family protein [Bacteroidota bacterium]|nr:2'-5' RNA ligase family protein [Bacteroidota bacterium]